MRKALGLALAGCLLVTACGAPVRPADPAAVALAAEANAICDEWHDLVSERGEFPVDDFDPEDPDPADLPAVGEYFASGLEAQADAIASLRRLSAAGELQAKLDALVAAYEAQYETAKAQNEAALSGEVDAFVATLADVTERNEAVNDAAEELGAYSCRF